MVSEEEGRSQGSSSQLDARSGNPRRADGLMAADLIVVLHMYLVTGCAGFIASKTIQLLIDAGEQVVGIDNLNDYYDAGLKAHRLEQLARGSDRFKFFKMDVEDRPSLHGLFGKHQFKAVLNLAARAGVRYSIENPHVYLETNAHGTLNLLELMRAFGVPKLVLASTSSLYAGRPMPFHEDDSVNTPISPYAATKKAAEVMAYTYHHLFGLDVSVLRYFTVYGPAGRPDMSYFRFIKLIDEGRPIELYGDGTQSRDFTYVDDIAAGTISAARKNLGYQIINLGGGNQPITINRMIEMIEGHLGKKAVIHFMDRQSTDMEQTWANIAKAKNLLGWQPKVPFEAGIASCVDWYRENKYWLKDIKV